MADALLGGREKPASIPPPENPPPNPLSFGQEFLRVQFDKMLLVGLIIFCWHVGYMDGVKGGFGALIYALQSNRFKWN